MAAKTIRVRGEGILLDQLLVAEFGPVLARAMLVPALELNAGLADAGALIPVGTDVVIPARPVGDAPPARPVVSLFG